jgi:hypothetical protein
MCAVARRLTEWRQRFRKMRSTTTWPCAGTRSARTPRRSTPGRLWNAGKSFRDPVTGPPGDCEWARFILVKTESIHQLPDDIHHKARDRKSGRATALSGATGTQALASTKIALQNNIGVKWPTSYWPHPYTFRDMASVMYGVFFGVTIPFGKGVRYCAATHPGAGDRLLALTLQA